MAFARSSAARMGSTNLSEVVAVILVQYGVSRRMAEAMAVGALSERRDTLRLAREYRLIAPVDTTEARAVGLVR